jgi:hypothetical protein
VQREADDEERAERERAGRVGRADRHALAEVVQADADGDEQRELRAGARGWRARGARAATPTRRSAAGRQ